MADSIKCSCGTLVDANANFCYACGNALTSRVACPQCGREVRPGNFCPKCGAVLKAATKAPDFADGVWQRGENDFAVRVPSHYFGSPRGPSIEIRHGSRALFFENGQLVNEAQSGRFPMGERELIGQLLKKGRKLSAILVDAGDTQLDFVFGNIRTRDRLRVDVAMTIVVRMEAPNRFFVNVIKEREVFKIHDLRQLLFAEMRNALQEAAVQFDLDDLSASLTTKTELASRMEVHLRQTLGSTGLGFEQVRTVSVTQATIDAADHQRASDEAAARAIETETLGRISRSNAEMAAVSADRNLRSRQLDADREAVNLETKEKEVRLYRKAEGYRKAIDERMLDAGHLEKRLTVLKRIRELAVEKIKTDEDFRKFRLEVDRDNALDEAEWQAFRDELTWQGEDRLRDRRFLTTKIDLQQQHDIDLLRVVNRADLSLEEKKREAEILDLELRAKVDRELRKMKGIVDIELVRVKADTEADRIATLGKKETEIDAALRDLELKKQAGETRLDIKKLEIEEKRLKSQLGLSNLERLKAIKRKDQHEAMLTRLEENQKTLEMTMAREEAEHNRKLDEMRLKATLETDRYQALAGLNLEQMIAVTDVNQARILGDLAQSRTLKGMSVEEIMAIRDPAALGKALEERAKNTPNDELKTLYERMLTTAEAASARESAALRESAERIERLAGEGFRSLAGKNQQLADSERQAGEKIVHFADRTVDRMGRVAVGSEPSPANGQTGNKVMVCRKCRAELARNSDFCSNCGEKV